MPLSISPVTISISGWYKLDCIVVVYYYVWVGRLVGARHKAGDQVLKFFLWLIWLKYFLNEAEKLVF